jgi:integrase
MAKPKFYLEPRPSADGKQNINMFYSFNGQRLQYYTGIRIEKKYFRPECNDSNVIKPIKTTAPYSSQDNTKLESIKNSAITIVSEAKGEKLNKKYVSEQLDLIYKPKKVEPQKELIKHTFVSFFEQLIEDSKIGKRVITIGGKKGNRYTRNTIKNYGITLSAIKRYMKHKGLKQLTFEAINKEFYDDFSFYCYSKEQKEKSTFAGYIKDIKTAMVESKTDGFNTKEFIMPSYEADTIYLNDAEIEQIANLDLTDSKKTVQITRGKIVENVSYLTLDKTRDLALIGFYSGLRFSDFSKLELKNIDKDFIKAKQIKTGKYVVIPIMQKLRPILEKYKDGLPTLSNQRFNDYIKLVAELAGLTENRTIKNTKGNIESETTAPLYTLISSHCCRRSYATNLFNAGYSPMLIMSATGHKTETSFLKYIRATNEDKAKLLAQAFEKSGL